ncbi:MAG: hypothetical protein JSV04_08835 [Candidatus Heimdallarchaeota archaeon]|nr:MAG: hypothetical protein JSV04_08835 [Candidatus Heimdallarchaeota archaeon]
MMKRFWVQVRLFYRGGFGFPSSRYLEYVGCHPNSHAARQAARVWAVHRSGVPPYRVKNANTRVLRWQPGC